MLEGTGDAETAAPVQICADCETTVAIVKHSGRWKRCACGNVFNPAARVEEDDHDAEDAAAQGDPIPPPGPRPEERVAWARARWPAVQHEVALARRYAARELGRIPGGPAEVVSLLGRMQGYAMGLSRDASEHQVALRWALLQREGEAGARHREDFRRYLLDWLGRNVRADEEVDWDHAARCWARFCDLARAGGDAARVLRVALDELAPGAAWETAVRVVADACAPAALRAAWSVREAGERGAIGRPRRSVVEPPVEAERLAWGEPRLAAAVEAWMGAVR